LETVLSRVVVISTPNVYKDKDNEMFSFWEFIKNYIERKNNDLISYFFKGKLEKEEYLKFLEDLFLYCKNNFCFIDYLEELNDDINWIKQNNLNARFIVDKWLVYMR
jgi:predicted CopG family antitoxin